MTAYLWSYASFSAFLNCEKTRVLIIASLTLRATLWVYQYVVFIGSIFHNTIETCLERVGLGGYEELKKEMYRFTEDMS